MRYIDCHTHVNFAVFGDDYREVIERALERDVFLVNVGTQQDTSRRAVEIANEFSGGVYATVGVHPIHTDKSHHDADELGALSETEAFTSRGEEFDYEYYKKLALDPKVVAIGETGLDCYRVNNQETRYKIQTQKKVFEEHIRLAHEVKKPLMIHCRDAFGDLIDILVKCQVSNVKCPGVVHFFSGTKEDARKLLDLGFSFTFGGVITFARDYDEIIRYVPLDRILSETDAPYVTPAPYRGKRNEPAYVVEVVKKLAEIRGVSEEEMKEQIWENAKRVFRI